MAMVAALNDQGRHWIASVRTEAKEAHRDIHVKSKPTVRRCRIVQALAIVALGALVWVARSLALSISFSLALILVQH
jgi:ferric-dicitrate binding protein FerR (iron transport regulator)